MTISDINSYVSFRASTDTTQYSAANRLISTNRWYHKITDMIYQSLLGYEHDDLNQSTEAVISKNTTTNQAYVDIGLTDKILNITRLEVSYDGTTYYKAEALQEGEVSGSIASQSAVAGLFSTTQPFYRHKGHFVYLYPVPTSSITGGLKMWVDREADEFTSGQVSTGTKEPGFDEPFHVMIALGMIFDWCSTKSGASPVLASLKQDVELELADYEARLRRHYGNKNTDNKLQFKSAFVNYE